MMDKEELDKIIAIDAFVDELKKLETVELFGIAKILGVDIYDAAKGTKYDEVALARAVEQGGDGFKDIKDWAMESKIRDGLSIVTDIIAAYKELPDNRKLNLMVLLISLSAEA